MIFKRSKFKFRFNKIGMNFNYFFSEATLNVPNIFFTFSVNVIQNLQYKYFQLKFEKCLLNGILIRYRFIGIYI